MIIVSEKTLNKTIELKGIDSVKNAINTSSSMREAAKKLGMSFTSFKRLAIHLNLYKTNQHLEGITDKARRGNPGRPKKVPVDTL